MVSIDAMCCNVRLLVEKMFFSSGMFIKIGMPLRDLVIVSLANKPPMILSLLALT